MYRLPTIGYFFLLSGLALADATLSAPVTGYVADPSMPVLRAVFGLPGSMLYSDPLVLPDGTTSVRVAPGRNFAWVECGTGSPGLLFLAGGAVDHFAAVPGALSSSDWVAFSPGASSAVLFSAASGRLQVLTGLPNSPTVSRDLDGGSLPAQPWTAAVSDDGQTLLMASEAAAYLLNPTGGSQLLVSGQKIHSVTLMPNGADAVVADSGSGLVFFLANVISAPAPRTLASNLTGVEYLSASSDGSLVVLAQPATQSVSLLDPVSGSVQSFAVSVPPASLQPLLNRDAFLISTQSGQPGWIFFRTGTSGQPLFIPTAATPPERQPRRGRQ